METKSPASLLILTQLIIILLVSAHSQGSKTCKLFNLGDSNSDTGAKCAGFGAPAITVILPGHDNLCRASDGRLYIDFLCESLGMDPLTPYLDSVGSDFSNGVNFAYVGAHIIWNGTVPLFIQAQQFARFEKRTQELLIKGKGPKITKSEFQNAIFSLDIGQNDLAIALGNSRYQQAVDYIPSLLDNIEQATKMLYGLNARKFMIYNTGPLGCLPHYLSAGKGFENPFWDNLHYTEAANKIVASKIGSGDVAWPYIKFKDLFDMEIKETRRGSPPSGLTFPVCTLLRHLWSRYQYHQA